MTARAEPGAAGPGEPAPPCSADELRRLFLFDKLSQEQLAWLCREGQVRTFQPGMVYAEGAPATSFYVLLEGTLVLYRRVGADDVEVNRTSDPGVYSGAFTAYLGERVPQVYNNSMRVTVPSRFFILDAAAFARLMHEWFPMAVHLLEGLFFGVQQIQQTVGQRERLLALGSLSAGLTHELNNPAAAAVRATAALRERIAGMRRKLAAVGAAGLDERATLQAVVELADHAAEKVSAAPALSPLEASDREDAIADWLDDRGVARGWDLAPTFVQAGFDTGWLDHVEATVGSDALEQALQWLSSTVETELLMGEITESTNRISNLVNAARQYSQLDRAPYQTTDVHELLNSTLVVLASKIGSGIRVVKEYDRSLPAVPAYPAELNQVWTNLIDNAVTAMNGQGTLTIRTALDDDHLLVEFADTGPGIPADVRRRIFEPFFTTKPVGEGTGLGLDISWRIIVNKHHGDLTVESVPGDTRFRVRLPLSAPPSGSMSDA